MAKRYPKGVIGPTSRSSNIKRLSSLSSEIADGTYEGYSDRIENSVITDVASDQFIEWIPRRSGNRKTFTMSWWIKRSALAVSGSNTPTQQHLWYAYDGSRLAQVFFERGSGIYDDLVIYGGGVDVRFSPTIRDTGAWHHIQISFDFPNRKIMGYHNGKHMSWAGSQGSTTTTIPASTTEWPVNDIGVYQRIGGNAGGATFQGSIAEVNFVDGLALEPTELGYYDANKKWQPKKYTGDYGVNGLYLPFNDTTNVKTLGKNRANDVKEYDEFWPQTSLLVQGSSTDNAGSRTLEDESSLSLTVSGSGDFKAGLHSPFNPKGWSAHCGAASRYLTLASAPLLNAAAYTVEFWMMPHTYVNAQGIFGASNGGGPAEKVAFQINGSSISLYEQGSAVLTAPQPLVGAWTHVLISRDANTGNGYIYYNGQLQTSGAVPQSTVSNPFQIFTNGEGDTSGMYGFLSDFRVSNVARHTGLNFAVPTEPLETDEQTVLHTLRDPYFEDRTNTYDITQSGLITAESYSPYLQQTDYNATVHGGSVFLDGTSDYITVNSGAVSNIGTGDYTIEGWFKPTDVSTDPDGLFRRVWSFGSGLTNDVSLNLSTSGNLVFRINDAIKITSSKRVFGDWNHVAISRSDGVTRMFINGKSQGSFSGTEDFTSAGTNSLLLGTYTATTGNMAGYIGPFRVVTGLGLYTEDNFTPMLETFGVTGNNRFADSERFDSTAWTKTSNVYIEPNVISAPNGEITADKFVFNQPNSNAPIYIGTDTNAVGTTFTTSFHVKAGSHQYVQISNNGDVNSYVNFDIANGTVGTSGSNATGAISNEGDGWYRISMVNSGGTPGDNRYLFAVPSSSASREQSWSGSGDFYVWGAQFENDATLSAYSRTPKTSAGSVTCCINFNTADVFDSTGSADFWTFGTCGTDTGTIKYGPSSIDLNVGGVAGNLRAPQSPLFDMYGDWTVEFWYKGTATSSDGQYRRAVDFGGNNANAALQVIIDIDGGGSYNAAQGGLFPWDGGNQIPSQGTGSHPNGSDGNWHHHAFVKNRDKLYSFFDGELVHTRAVSAGAAWIHSDQGTDFVIGAASNDSNAGRAIANIEDFRITKGVARYISDFTPPAVSAARTVSDAEPNNAALRNITTADVTKDSPSDYADRGNYCIVNWNTNVGQEIVLSDGGLTLTNGNNTWATILGTHQITSGKWYFETTYNATWLYGHVGVIDVNTSLGTLADGNSYLGGYTGARAYQQDGRLWNDGAATSASAPVGSSGDVAMVALDMDTNKIWFGLNGTWFSSGDPANGTNEIYSDVPDVVVPGFSVYGSSSGMTVNFGQKDFAYTPPAGFQAINTTNLPHPSIASTQKYFATTLYTGDEKASHNIEVGHQPDLIWIKRRDGGSDHVIQDSVRGFGSTTKLSSSSTQHQNDTDSLGSTGVTDPHWGYVNSTYEKGFNINVGNAGDQVNNLQSPYVAWTWKAGGTPVTNTEGDISAQVSANVDAGFSIIRYTGNGTAGQTVGHGLNSAPQFYVQKRIDDTSDWGVSFNSSGSLLYIPLNLDNASISSSASMPTNSLIYISGGGFALNQSSGDYITYAWHEIEGYSKIGSYTGTNVSPGPFVYTGFRPAWILLRRIDAARDWLIYDNLRPGDNRYGSDGGQAGNDARNWYLYANTSGAENTTFHGTYIFSNGFQPYTAESLINADGGTYIYMAFAESPFKHARGR